jgi:KipI family sensor histidine kinase inhibitor
MILEPLGDSAYLARELRAPAWQVAEAWRAARLPGVREVVAAYDTVALMIDPRQFESAKVVEPMVDAIEERPIIEVPVRYDGPDLAEVTERLGWTAAQVIEAHTASVYTCYAVGFCPGFPYLGYLEGELATLGRRPEPRVKVPTGSVAIAGRQTGIYPLERPGGWWLLGRTEFTVVDLQRGYFAFSPGDRVRFVPI